MVKNIFCILIIIVFCKQASAQLADAAPREYQHFIINVPHNYYDSTTYETLYLFPPDNEYTKQYRPFYTMSMRTTTFEIGANERNIFMEQYASEVLAIKKLKPKLINKTLENNRAEINYYTIENKKEIFNRLVIFFDKTRFVLLTYKDLPNSLFLPDTEMFFSTLTFK